ATRLKNATAPQGAPLSREAAITRDNDSNATRKGISMNGTARRLLALAITSSLAVPAAGCWSSQPVKPVTPADASASKKEEAFIRPLLEGWEPPKVALMLSGEMLGYLEPCGCSLTQSGGLERRGDLQRKIVE